MGGEDPADGQPFELPLPGAVGELVERAAHRRVGHAGPARCRTERIAREPWVRGERARLAQAGDDRRVVEDDAMRHRCAETMGPVPARIDLHVLAVGDINPYCSRRSLAVSSQDECTAQPSRA
ncbi:MAG: hypothetical protein DLM67_11255 [Candidatus Nephthysia bennettiae]|nr:MAG: hypothetical protein DLM67_11255 [Candidatus Dormibacteraeota bacterium]